MDAPDFFQQGPHKPFGADVTANSKYKTQACRNFVAKGKCKYGDNCIFAHSSEDRRRNTLDCKIVGDEVVEKKSNLVNECMPTRGTCRFLLTDRGCPYGSKCVFKHEGFKKSKENQDIFRESWAISIQSGGLNVKTNPWLKTRLCRSWMMHNTCTYGAECTFAHGNAELVPSPTSVGPEFGNSLTALMTQKNEALAYNAGNKTAEHKVPQEMSLVKWKTMKKIVGIYADWIDQE